MDDVKAKGVAIRMPRDLRIWIGIQAAKAMRSVNSEVIERLERTRHEDEPTAAGTVSQA